MQASVKNAGLFATYIMLTLITPATLTTPSLADVKLHLRVNISDDDTLIQDLISAAQATVEHDCNLSLGTTTWKETFPEFPVFRSLHPWWSELRHEKIYPLKRPLQSVTSVQYYDINTNVLTTLDPSLYIVETPFKLPGVIAPLTFCFPLTWTRDDAVTVTYVAGFATMPSVAIQVIKLLVEGWYYARENQVASQLEAATQRLLSQLNTSGYPG
jgi:uncharacterized phiE125 gp8 family phage protein